MGTRSCSRIFVFLALLHLAICQSPNDVNPLLQPDSASKTPILDDHVRMAVTRAEVKGLLAARHNLFVGHPGVRARLTPSGVTYVAGVVTEALTAEVAHAVMPVQQPSVKLSTVAVTSSKPILQLFAEPSIVLAEASEPNLLKAQLKDMNISVISTLHGNIDGQSVNGQMILNTAKFYMEITISVRRNARGNPLLKIDSCRVPTNFPVSVSYTSTLSPKNLQKLSHAGMRSANVIFENAICPRLTFMTETRINQRFGLLSSKISLAQTIHFDLLKNLVEAEEALKRSVRQNEMSASGRPIGRMSRRRASVRVARQARKHQKMDAIMQSFNLSRADNLILDYAMLAPPRLSARGIEIESSGEIAAVGGRTPFGPKMTSLPADIGKEMLQIVVSDFVPNTLMYHGHRIGLFNTRVDPSTPQFGSVMRTTCDLSTGSLFCVGDLFPTLREVIPDREVVFLFSTLRAPALIVRPEDQGGIHFELLGLIEIHSIDPTTKKENHVGSMEIHLEAKMKMRLSSKAVKGKVSLETITLKTRSPQVLMQDELDDAGLLSREILQRMVNDILKQGVPIPVHPLFKLHKPTMKLMNRHMLLETSFHLNSKLIKQLTAAELKASN